MNIRDDTTENSLDQVLATATICRQHLANKAPMKWLILEQRRGYNNATKCLICAKLFKSADKKICDHDHLTGEYRDPVHNVCNLNYRIDLKKVKIPCIIHNLIRYIVSILQLFSHLLVFETHFDSYFYVFCDSHFHGYFLFHSTNFLNTIL